MTAFSSKLMLMAPDLGSCTASLVLTVQDPLGALTLVGSSLYGSTLQGGASNDGTIFEIGTDGTGFTTLASFDGTNGESPEGGLVFNNSTLYGTASDGGVYSDGTVFALNLNPTPRTLHPRPAWRRCYGADCLRLAALVQPDRRLQGIIRPACSCNHAPASNVRAEAMPRCVFLSRLRSRSVKEKRTCQAHRRTEVDPARAGA